MISVGSDTSVVMKVLTGIPHGSVLGPRSFIHYAEDLKEISEREEVKYLLYFLCCTHNMHGVQRGRQLIW